GRARAGASGGLGEPGIRAGARRVARAHRQAAGHGRASQPRAPPGRPGPRPGRRAAARPERGHLAEGPRGGGRPGRGAHPWRPVPRRLPERPGTRGPRDGHELRRPELPARPSAGPL
ncbi:MAG: hypothetical protein AVDCRST_MAG05-4390, partial [uncultured Rubrobacteraceae bacterium]